MILSDIDIRERLGKTVIIDPYNPANVNTSSYDVTLGEFYYIEHKPSWWQFRPIFNIWDFDDVERVWGEQPLRAEKAWEVLPRRLWRWHNIDPEDSIILIPPGHTILAHTREFIGGRVSVTSMMQARSSFGRNFIEVCKCAGYGDVGYINRWTMEITNNSRFYRIPLIVGRRIAQIIFMETGQIGEKDYTATGKYQQRRDVRDLISTWRPSLMLPRLDRDREILKPCPAGEDCKLKGGESACGKCLGDFCPHANEWDECPVCRH